MVRPRVVPGARARWGYHAGRWALLLLVALVTHLVFPTPAIVEVPYYPAGATAERTVIATVSVVVR